jgi:hypothetical protein
VRRWFGYFGHFGEMTLPFYADLRKQLHVSDTIQTDSQARPSILDLYMEGRACESGKD